MYSFIQREEEKKSKSQSETEHLDPYSLQHLEPLRRKKSQSSGDGAKETSHQRYMRRLNESIQRARDEKTRTEQDAEVRKPDASVTREQTKSVSPAKSVLIQKSGDGTATASPQTEAKIDSMRKSGGTPLESSTREFMESRMGHDFSDVRIHKGSDAESTSKDLNAKAYTVGKDIAFGKGEYQPETHEGKKLIAHELTHTIQQGGVRRKEKKNPQASTKMNYPEVLPAIQSEPIQKKDSPDRKLVVQRVLRGRKLRNAIKSNRDDHKYTDGLAYQLLIISGNYKLYARALSYARTRLGTRKVKGKLETIPGSRGIGVAFTRLVAAAQTKIGISAHGHLDEVTLLEGAAWRRRNPKSIAEKAVNYTLDGAIWLIKKIDDKWFLPTAPIGLIFKHGVIGFLRRFAQEGGDSILKIAWRIAKALSSWAFVKNYVISFVKGFFVDGFWGTLKLIWEIVKLPYTIGKFAWSVLKFIGQIDAGKVFRGIRNGIVKAANWVTTSGKNFVDNIVNLARGGDKKGLADHLSDLYNGAKGMLQKGGARFASYLIRFFKKEPDQIGSALGKTIGRFGGGITFDVLLGILTVGSSAGLSAIARFVRPVMKWLKRTGKRAKDVVVNVWKNIGILTRIVSSQILGWAGKVSKPLAKNIRSIVNGLRNFFTKLKDRLKPKLSGKNSAKNKNPSDPKNQKRKPTELAEALVKAKGITTVQDKANTPVGFTLGLLNALKKRYNWIKLFVAVPITARFSHFSISMVASNHPIDPDYSGKIPPIRATRVGIDSKKVGEIKSDMLEPGAYKYTEPRGQIAILVDSKGIHHISEGHHRMTAALEIFKETGNAGPVRNLLRHAKIDPQEFVAKSRPMTSRKFWGRLWNRLGF